MKTGIDIIDEKINMQGVKKNDDGIMDGIFDFIS